MGYFFRNGIAKFNPDQPRDRLGRWTDGGGTEAAAASPEVESRAKTAGLAPGSSFYVQSAYWVKGLREERRGRITALLGSDYGDMVLREHGDDDWEVQPARSNPASELGERAMQLMTGAGKTFLAALRAAEYGRRAYERETRGY